MCCFRKSWTFFGIIQELEECVESHSISHSMGLSDGNQVDGLPAAQHTKAVWGPHGVFGPAPIDKSGPRKLKIEEQNDMTLPERRVGVSVCICTVVVLEFRGKLFTRR